MTPLKLWSKAHYYWLTFALVVAAPTGVSAQMRDRASLWFEGLPSAELADGNGASGASIQAQAAEFYVADRFFLDEEGSSLLNVALSFRNNFIQTQNAPGLGGVRNVAGIVPILTLLHSIDEKNTLVVQARPGIFTDFTNMDGDHFRMEGSVLWDHVWNERWTLGLGAARTSNFGKVLYLPLFHALGMIGNDLWLDLLLPGRGELYFLPSKDWELGAMFNIVGSQYAIGEQGLGFDTLQYANVLLGPTVRYRLGGNAYLGLEAGYTVLRRAIVLNGDQELFSYDPGRTFFTRVGLQLRF